MNKILHIMKTCKNFSIYSISLVGRYFLNLLHNIFFVLSLNLGIVTSYTNNALKKKTMQFNFLLLKKGNQLCVHIIVISIFLVLFNGNVISFCMEEQQGPKNYSEALQEAVNNEDLPSIENILQGLNNITDPAHRQNIQSILQRHLIIMFPDQYQINTETFTVTQGSIGHVPARSWLEVLGPIFLVAGLTLSIWLLVRYYDNIHQFFFDVGEQVINITYYVIFSLLGIAPKQ